MKNFLIIVLSLGLAVSAFLTRPDREEFERYVREHNKPAKGNPLESILKGAAVQGALDDIEFKDCFLWTVVKKDGKREGFDRNKVLAGLMRACEKRPISMMQLESIVDEIEKELQDSSDREIPTTDIGKIIMRRLKALDKVAYVRFASVYLEFEDVSAFMTELKDLVRARAPEKKHKKAKKPTR